MITAEQQLFIEKHMFFAKSIARKKHRKIRYLDLDELVCAAYMGLVDAVSKYSHSKGEFFAYAKIRINGEIQDYLRSLCFGSKGNKKFESILTLDL